MRRSTLRRLPLLLALGLVLLLVACEGEAEDAATEATSDTAVTAVADADTPESTATTEPVAPTKTPEPTATATTEPTPVPTNTPKPSPTPKPTNTPTPVPPTPTATIPPTPTPEPTPTMTIDEQKAQYRGDLDVREVDKNIDAYYNWKLFYEGEVLTIFQDEDRTLLQVQVMYPGGSIYDRIVIVVLYNDPHAGDGIFEDDTVAVWARPITMFDITNAYGGKVSQPLFEGDFIEKR